ncbi:MAG: single-stranded-DNA-specific exonuclease RecJ [Desulfobacteraceae bacterium]
MQMQWKILQPDPAKVEAIRQHLNCHPITATVLANRNIETPPQADRFLQPTLDALPSPMGLHGMEAATRRILAAMQRKEKILIFGDYDADGVTATALLSQFFRSAGADVMVHIPHRIEEGYGLQPKHINQLAAPQKVGLIITVDNGSSSHAAVAAAERFGIDVIITDHHNFETLPDAEAVINPKLEGQPPELAELAGVGVAFYLAIGLRMVLRDADWWKDHEEPRLIDLCDLVAIGTIADMVPLTGANRILSKAGLKQMNSDPRPGIEALCRTCHLHSGSVTSEDIAFRLAPRINAAGRISHAARALELLVSRTPDTAGTLAETLDQLNLRRQAIEREIYNGITRRMDSRDDLLRKKSILLADDGWHSGVLGIVAAKLAARYHRPVVLLAVENGMGKGSGRSIPGLDLFGALSRCEPLLEQFGGHRLAAGLTVRSENIRKLQSDFETSVSDMTAIDDQTPQLEIDSVIQFDQIGPQLLNELKTLEPFGSKNPQPIFAAREVFVASAAIVGQYHRRMSLWQTANQDNRIDAIQFNLDPDTPKADRFEQMAFRLQWNQYRGRKRVQIVVEDF